MRLLYSSLNIMKSPSRARYFKQEETSDKHLYSYTITQLKTVKAIRLCGLANKLLDTYTPSISASPLTPLTPFCLIGMLTSDVVEVYVQTVPL